MQYVCMVPQCKGGTCTSRHLLVLWPAEVRAVCCCHAVAGLFRCARRGGGAERHAHIVWNPAFSSIKVQYLCLAHVMAHGAASREVQFKSLRSLNDYSLLVLLHVSYIATAQPTTIIRMCVCVRAHLLHLFSAPLLDSSPLVTKMAAPSNAVKLKSHSSSSGEKQGGCCHGKTILDLMRVF